MEAFCVKLGLQKGSIRFSFDGNRISPEQTAEGLGMQEGDVIDAMVEQTGGCGAPENHGAMGELDGATGETCEHDGGTGGLDDATGETGEQSGNRGETTYTRLLFLC